MTKNSQLQEIEIVPGVMPPTDATASDIPCWTSAYGIRFDPNTGRPRKIGGYTSSMFDYNAVISGTIRTIYSAIVNQKVYTILGTQCNLYSLIGSRLVNITPSQASGTLAANSISTHFGTLANNPVNTTVGSKTISITDSSYSRYQVNDSYKLSGAATTNGISNTLLNTTHVVRSITPGSIVFSVTSAATTTGVGGGASVVRSDGLINVSSTNTVANGNRIRIANSSGAGGITASEINAEFIVRNATPSSFDVMTDGFSTSSVSASGGFLTTYYPQIACGNLNQGLGQGYGAGFYGVGLYGTALVSTTGITLPRIWFVDRYGDNLVMTPGNSSGVYTWDGSDAMAPILVSGAPTDINYSFVSDNILVTFGHDVENKIFSSDQGDITQWVASSSNQVFEDIIEGAGRFISHAPVDGYNLIFTSQQTYTMKYIGLPLIWQILPLDPNIGIIAPMARCSVNGIAYWMGQENFQMFRGGKVETIPSNFGVQSSIWRYVYDDINFSQASKIFAWHNEEFDEIWWHYPSTNSNECDKVARLNRKLLCWVPDVMNRTAGEYPDTNLTNPRTADMSSLYVQESGTDAAGTPLPFSATTKKYLSGKDTFVQTQFIPDFNMSGTVTIGVNAYNYPQSTVAMNSNNYSVTATTEKVPMQLNGRYYDYTFSGNELGQTFLMGQCLEEPQKGPTAP